MSTFKNDTAQAVPLVIGNEVVMVAPGEEVVLGGSPDLAVSTEGRDPQPEEVAQTDTEAAKATRNKTFKEANK